MRAKYIGKCRDKYSNAVNLFYEYRGSEYMVTDMHNGIEDLGQQHRDEQQRIDREIDQKIDNKDEYRGESWEVGFKIFWDSVEQ